MFREGFSSYEENKSSVQFLYLQNLQKRMLVLLIFDLVGKISITWFLVLKENFSVKLGFLIWLGWFR